MIDIVNGLRRIAEEGYRFAGDAADEIERLRASLEAAEKDIALKEQVIDALGSELNAVAKERDALRALVVMRFDHDYPPQFTQGHDLHELTEPVTAEHCRWFVAEIERLRTACDALRAKITEMEKQAPTHWSCNVLQADASWKEEVGREIPPDGYYSIRDIKPLYALPGAKGEEK